MNGETVSFDLEKHLLRQKKWSRLNFGPGRRTKGIIAHIRKELKEIGRNPDDLEEWIDVVILGLDGAWRSGASIEEIVAMISAKQQKNEKREWPDWRTLTEDDPIEHIEGKS